MTRDLQKTVGRRIREHRKNLGISQEKFAEQINFHRTYLGSLERGERNLTLGSLEDLAERLGVDPLDLLQD